MNVSLNDIHLLTFYTWTEILCFQLQQEINTLKPISVSCLFCKSLNQYSYFFLYKWISFRHRISVCKALCCNSFSVIQVCIVGCVNGENFVQSWRKIFVRRNTTLCKKCWNYVSFQIFYDNTVKFENYSNVLSRARSLSPICCLAWYQISLTCFYMFSLLLFKILPVVVSYFKHIC